MRRDFSLLGGGPFDLLVIGGGIYGSWTALDASLRGLRVGLVRKTLKERAFLSHLAPHQVRPRRFVVPLCRGARRGPALMKAGLRRRYSKKGFCRFSRPMLVAAS